MEFSQVYPRQRSAELADLLDELGPADPSPPDRPHVSVNFVSTADGRAAIGGRSGPLSSDGDRAMFHGLRARVDAVLAGTGTMITERYGRMIKDPDTRRTRAERGLAEEPLAVVVTRMEALPGDIPLLSEPAARVVVFGTPALRVTGDAQVEVVALDPAELTLTTALRRLHRDFAVRWVLCEGGPTLFGALLMEGVVDELFLTVAPLLAGGGRGPTITSGPELAEPRPLRLAWALECDESLFLRYIVG